MTKTNAHPQSFEPDGSRTTSADGGQLVHETLLAHNERLAERLYSVTDGVWCVVGNGLSNQTFVEGPDGIIAIDSGESVEEMSRALAMLREHTTTPVVAMIATHFHYIAGTEALFAEPDTPADLPIWGHDGIAGNLARMASEVNTVAGRGLVHQFGMSLPADGPDGLVNVGLGMSYRRVEHAPFTNGYRPPTHTFTEPTTATIAGLTVEMTPAPSDADDSITIWFPSLKLCVNNLIWPVLFNVFAIRGEEYRDPRILLNGIDHIGGLAPEHLVCAHGPPLSGAERIADEVVNYRDSIAFMWDQTVRGINRGLSQDELTEFVQLPDHFSETYFTQQTYGLVEHHVRQVATGLRGWFDGAEENLFPMPTVDRANRLIKGFGGVDAVRAQARTALDDDDLRWALELASWLVRREPGPDGRADGGEPADRELLADVLRAVARRTTSANVRNWCLTRALELAGEIDVARHRVHRFARGAVLAGEPATAVHTLRVLLDPDRAGDLDHELRWEVDGEATGLRIRRSVGVPTDGTNAETAIAMTKATLAELLATKISLDDALDSGAITVTAGDEAAVRTHLACFDHRAFTN